MRRSRTRRLPPRLKQLVRRRRAIEPTLGHMKNDGRTDRNWLMGEFGDAIHALLCGDGHDLRLILTALRAFLAFARSCLPALSATITLSYADLHA